MTKAKLITSYCENCGKQEHHPVHRPFKYCNNVCQGAHRVRLGYEAAERGELVSHGIMRNFLLARHGYRCDWCKETHKMEFVIPLELEHTDGNHKNTTLSNCRMLCPTCHALTSTYKNRNKGNGRAARRQRYQDGKSY